jgi:hypothetical protein
MGHNRFGRLPQTRRWQEVIQLLTESPGDTARIGAAVLAAANTRFEQLANEQTVAYPLWLLARVAWASRGTRFISELNSLGVSAGSSSTALDVISAIADQVRREASAHPPTGHFSEFAVQALRSALTATVALQGKSLFDSGIRDLKRAFRAYSTSARFGEVVRRFVANFMSRALLSFVDRELPRHVGSTSMPTTRDATEFKTALDTHAWEAAAVIEQFAGDWYSKRNWETSGAISRQEAQGFVAVGLRKLRAEFRRRAEPR